MDANLRAFQLCQSISAAEASYPGEVDIPKAIEEEITAAEQRGYERGLRDAIEALPERTPQRYHSYVHAWWAGHNDKVDAIHTILSPLPAEPKPAPATERPTE
ncbi:MAG TPA: hypothetical protein VKA63_05420 [Candidatus Krumholzibacteria bacterium]|nr:hypothetical protein [Candidatus Krumholzibacteria bacterium]